MVLADLTAGNRAADDRIIAEVARRDHPGRDRHATGQSIRTDLSAGNRTGHDRPITKHSAGNGAARRRQDRARSKVRRTYLTTSDRPTDHSTVANMPGLNDARSQREGRDRAGSQVAGTN